jgi:hypothetical protein
MHFASLKKRILNREGFTLTEVMVLGSIFLVLIVSFAAYQFQQDKARKAKEVTTSYKTFEKTAREKAVQPQSVSRSEELDLSKME